MSLQNPGELVQLSPLVARVLAPNPSWETGPGTNTYLVGRERLSVIDPGPDMPEHVEAILRHAGDRLARILVTHTHEDHSPAAASLAARTGLPVMGLPGGDDGYQDRSFAPHEVLGHDALVLGGDHTLRSIHTPGHVGNHLCYLLEEEGVLFTGDHIMSGSTVVIIPPSGDMGDYLRSLALLRQYPLNRLAPGHGEMMDAPQVVIEQLINHRLRRELKVLDALRQLGQGGLDTLLLLAYDDVDPSVHGLARLSLWAHLLKLATDGHAREVAGEWHFVGAKDA